MPPTKEPHPRQRDGFTGALGGVNSSLEPDAIQPNQLAFAVNVRLRGGFPESRPGFLPQTDSIQFPDEFISAYWNTHTFQGSFPFETPDGQTLLALAVGGRFFTVSPVDNFSVREITATRSTSLVNEEISPGTGQLAQFQIIEPSIVYVGLPVTIGDGRYMVTANANSKITVRNIDATPGLQLVAGSMVTALDINATNRPSAYFAQAEDWLLIQDGQSPTVISNGFSSRRRALDEVPVGTVMQYHGGRLWVAVNGNQVAVGDIVSFNGNESLLKFTEENIAATGGRFRVGGTIKAMAQLAALDASLGQGPLQVITRDDFNSFNLPAQRELWNTLTYPFQTVSLTNFGALGADGVQIVNGDCYYRAPDGLRSFIMARRQFGGPGNTPMSAELDRVLKGDDSDSLLEFTSTVLFDNRLLFTVQPQRSGIRPYFKGIGALDFNPISRMGQKGEPIWDGLWTGLKVYQLVVGKFNGVERCFAWTQEADGLGLWEISKDAPFDGDSGRIKSWIEYPTLKWRDPFDLKRLASSKVFVSDIIGTVDFTMRFRPDDAACWIAWNEKQLCAKANSCKSGDCYKLQTFKAGYKPHLSFCAPPEECEEYDNKNARYGYQFQMRLEWEGHAKIKRMIAFADMNQEQLEESDAA